MKRLPLNTLSLALSVAPATAQFQSPVPVLDTMVRYDRLYAVSDLDLDGVPDLIVGHERGGLGVALGGPASTTGFKFIDAEGSTVALQCADMDGDGDADLVLYESARSIHWRENDGAGQFVAEHPISTAAGVPSVDAFTAADFDGDGAVDVLVRSSTRPELVLMTNDGTGAFGASRVVLALPHLSGYGAADMDLDGDLDVFARATVGNDTTVFVLENLGSGAFGVLTRFTTGSHGAFSMLDFDGDGDADLVRLSPFQPSEWVENVGGASFVVHPVTLPTGVNQATRTLHDLDGDGDLDLLGSLSGGGGFAWAENQGASGFAAFAPVVTGGEAVAATPSVVADVDLDGDMDVVTAALPLAGGPFAIGWFECLGGLSFAPWTAFHPELRPFVQLAASDLDLDGRVDFVATRYQSATTAVRNLGGGAFAEVVGSVTLPSANRVELADLDGDGDEDLIGQGAGTWIAINVGGDLRSVQVLQADSVGFAVGDIDGDGRPDVLSHGPGANGVTVAQWTRVSAAGVAGPPTAVQLPVGSASFSLAAVLDLERDGDGDLVTVDSTGVARAFENAAGAWQARAFRAGVGAAVASLTVVDVDGDAALDLVVGGLFVNDCVLRGGDFNLAPAGGYVSFTADIDLADVDRDGRLDLLIPDLGAIAVGYQRPNLTFSAPRVTPTRAHTTRGLTAADFDNDGRIDVAAIDLRAVVTIAYGASGGFEVYCDPAVPNATGRPAQITFEGSTRIADHDTTLTLTELPPGAPAVFLVADGTDSVLGYRGSLGTMCLASTGFGFFTGPGEIQFADAAGQASLDIDVSGPLAGSFAALPGRSLAFQAWYRDASVTGASASNLSSAMLVRFE
ncbi:MAG: VCBS repeat-containing protein [Planctomycetota bacterium]